MILAYRDDTATDIPEGLDMEDPERVRPTIWNRVGYVRIDLDVFKQWGEALKGPSLFEWHESRSEEKRP